MGYIGHADEQQTFPERKVESFTADNGTGPYILTKMVPGGYAGNIEVFFGAYSAGRPTYNRLRPQTDYSIGGTGSNLNRELSLTFSPAGSPNFDTFFVVHDASSTYNLVPAPGSVTADSLQSNLRQFVFETFNGNNSDTEFTLSQDVPYHSAIAVFVGGVYKAGDLNDGNPDRDYYIKYATSAKTLKFRSAPGTGTNNIAVLHLSFSTVSNYTTLTSGLGNDVVQETHIGTGQVSNRNLATNSVTGTKIQDDTITGAKLQSNVITQAKMADDSVGTAEIINSNVTTAKIADDNVTSGKILLANNTALRANNSTGTAKALAKIDASNVAHLGGDSGITKVAIDVNGSPSVNFTGTSIEPENSGGVTVGTSGRKVGDIHSSGAVNAVSASFSGNVAVSGTVDTVDVSAFKAAYDLLFPAGTPAYEVDPPGTIKLYAGIGTGTVANPAAPNGYLLCSGQEVSQVTYARLWTAFGQQHIYGSASTGNFRIPDLRNRIAVGKCDGNALGGNDGVATYTNRTPTVHSHTLSHGHAGLTFTGTVGANSHSHSVTVSGNYDHTHHMNDHTHNMDHLHAVWGHGHSIPDTWTRNGDGGHSHSGTGRTAAGAEGTFAANAAGSSGSSKIVTTAAGDGAHNHYVQLEGTTSYTVRNNTTGQDQRTSSAMALSRFSNDHDTDPISPGWSDQPAIARMTQTGIPNTPLVQYVSTTHGVPAVLTSTGSTQDAGSFAISVGGSIGSAQVSTDGPAMTNPHLFLNYIIRY